MTTSAFFGNLWPSGALQPPWTGPEQGHMGLLLVLFSWDIASSEGSTSQGGCSGYIPKKDGKTLVDMIAQTGTRARLTWKTSLWNCGHMCCWQHRQSAEGSQNIANKTSTHHSRSWSQACLGPFLQLRLLNRWKSWGLSLLTHAVRNVFGSTRHTLTAMFCS